MKISLGITNFLVEISSLFPFYCFPLFLCIGHWRRLSYLYLLFSGTLHSVGYIFPFLTLPSCISISLGQLWSLPPKQWYKPLSIVLQAFCLSDLILWIYSSPLLYNHKEFDLGHTWMTKWFFPTFVNLSMNFAIRTSCQPQSAPGLVFAGYIELLRLQLQRI